MMKTLCQRRFAECASYTLADSELKRKHGSGIDRDQYGHSDHVNVSKKQNREFQDGYSVGVETLGYDAAKMINEEGHLRAEVCDDLFLRFEETQRGFWAAWFL